MSTKVKVACVGCGDTCTAYRYRCPACSRTERFEFDRLTGRDKARMEAAAERRAVMAWQRLADAESDLALGIEPERIAADQGCTVSALARLAWRLGRDDLSNLFQRATERRSTYRRTGSCADCGGECRSESERCVDCYRRAVRGDAA